jgi:hypothetical protein
MYGHLYHLGKPVADYGVSEGQSLIPECLLKFDKVKILDVSAERWDARYVD